MQEWSSADDRQIDWYLVKQFNQFGVVWQLISNTSADQLANQSVANCGSARGKCKTRAKLFYWFILSPYE